MPLVATETVSDAFGPWLDAIVNLALRELAVAFLRRAAPRFYTAPSSTKGSVHPADEFFAGPAGDPTHAPPLGARWGGQVLHVARVCYVGRLLADAWGLAPLEAELVVAGALCHDIGKFAPGETKIDPHHDSAVVVLTADLATVSRFRHFYPRLLGICEAHQGRFGVRMPADPVEQAVATADYLASRPGFGGFDPYPKEPDFR
jgi:hypothetical protein